MREAAVLVVAAALCVPGSAASQTARDDGATAITGSVEGRVADANGAGLADVSVAIVGTAGGGTVSNAQGRFTLAGLAAGPVQMRLSRLGYTTRTVLVHIRSGDPVPLEVSMSEEAIELAPIDVRVTEPFLESNGFYRRSARGLGRQYSRARLDELSVLEVSDAVRLIPGVSLGYDPSLPTRVIASRPRRGASGRQVCTLTVFVDGVRTLDPDVNQVPSDWLAAMEVYLGAEAPAQYRVTGGCGVVLLWTKQRGGV